MNQIKQLGFNVTFVGIALAFALSAASTRAAIIAYEDFESYPDGASIVGGNGGTGWSQPWLGNTTTGAPTTQNVSSGKIAGYGKSLELGTGVVGDNRGIGVRQFPAQTGDVYIGMVLQTSNGWDGDFWQMYLNNVYSTADGTGSSFSAGLLNDSPTNRYFARKGGTNTNNSTLQHTSTNNNIHTFVVKFSKSTGLAGDLYDQVSLWVDQTIEGTPTASLGAADTGTTALNSATLSTFHFRVSQLEATDRIYLDEFKVATTFAEALPVPEPASAWLLVGSFAAIAVCSMVQRELWRRGWRFSECERR